MNIKYRIPIGLLILLICVSILPGTAQKGAPDGPTDNSVDWFHPGWAAGAKYNRPIAVLDTDSALGRYSPRTKEIGLKDLARIHGHLCDGLIIAFVEIKAALERIFPDGVVDRTDLRAVSKNGPCWVDAAAFMTGARINFQTLRIDDNMGDGFIIQRISTGEAFEVRLKAGVFPSELATLEDHLRRPRSEGGPVSAADVDRYEVMAAEFGRRLLNTLPDELLTITHRPHYVFKFNDLYGHRGDITNRDVPR